MARACWTPDGPATVTLDWSGPSLEVEAWGPGRDHAADAAQQMAAIDRLPVEVAECHPVVSEAARRLRGVRTGRSGDLYHALLPTILAQRITSGEAVRQWASLCRQLGEPAPQPSLDLLLPPAPDRLAGRPAWWFHPLGIEAKRARAVAEIGRIADRLWDWVRLPAAELAAKLRLVRGVGAWTVGSVLGPVCGNDDAVPVGDYHLPHIVAWNLAGEARGRRRPDARATRTVPRPSRPSRPALDARRQPPAGVRPATAHPADAPVVTASTVTSDAARTVPDQPPVVERSRRPWLWAGLLTAALTAPVLWVTLSRHYTNGSDWASIEMRTRDVFSVDPPVVGAYSRMGWSHPGPLLFYLLAVPYRLFGQDANAMQLGAILVNVVVIALIVWLLSRRGRAPLVAGSVAIAATMWGLPADSLGDTWNATLAVLPFFLTIVACWSCACGDRAAPIVGAGAYAVAAQAHVGFAFVAGPLVVATVLYVLFTPNLRQRLARRLVWAAALIAVLSLPLLVDTLRDWPGNLPASLDGPWRTNRRRPGSAKDSTSSAGPPR